jgi:hypothetical protein
MPVELAKELWSELKRYVNTVDRDEAAETVVSVLIDNDVAPDEIKATFKSDPDIKRALTEYLRDGEAHEEDEEDDEDLHDDDDDDYENY